MLSNLGAEAAYKTVKHNWGAKIQDKSHPRVVPPLLTQRHTATTLRDSSPSRFKVWVSNCSTAGGHETQHQTPRSGFILSWLLYSRLFSAPCSSHGRSCLAEGPSQCQPLSAWLKEMSWHWISWVIRVLHAGKATSSVNPYAQTSCSRLWLTIFVH